MYFWKEWFQNWPRKLIALSVFERELIIVSGQSLLVMRTVRRILRLYYERKNEYCWFNNVIWSWAFFILKEYAYLQHSFCLYSWVVHKVTPYQYPWDGISNVQSNDTPNGHGNPFSDANCCCCCFGIKKQEIW